MCFQRHKPAVTFVAGGGFSLELSEPEAIQAKMALYSICLFIMNNAIFKYRLINGYYFVGAAKSNNTPASLTNSGAFFLAHLNRRDGSWGMCPP